uniref:EF-hand domain-containing protein n=1 Tax=Meloidogyne hapla TaxID=6305 RepID=A0A1I8B0T0_MELHA
MFIYKIILFYFCFSYVFPFPIDYFDKSLLEERETNKNNLWEDNYLFNSADTNSDGFISFAEYSSAWGARNHLNGRQLNRVIRLPYLFEHFKRMDIDRDELLNYNEFIYDISNLFFNYF